MTYKFPSAERSLGGSGPGRVGRASRERLVAARVTERSFDRAAGHGACAVVGGDDPDLAGRIMSSTDLVREIEGTLERMQTRLNDFREQMDAAFPFPGGDDDLPPAA